jgi:ATP-dependent metalloprotease FtsH
MQNRQRIENYIPYIIIVMAIFFVYFFNGDTTSKNEEYNYRTLQTAIEKEEMKDVNVIINNVVLTVKGTVIKNGEEIKFTATIPNTEQITNQLMDTLASKGVDIKTEDANERNVLLDMVISVMPYVLMIGVGYYFLSKSSNAANKSMEFGKSRARLEDNIKVKFTDVAGADEEKFEMQELIDYLKNPRKYAKMGARIPKGVLLVGPPGTGKTLLARAVAGEADVPFYSISGSDFVEMFVGVGASRVRKMFEQAKKTSPCIIFLDEIDAVGRERGAGLGGGNDEREQTLNQLLVEMDGINDNEGILIVAATNRPDVLDPAILRPGRFDRQIVVNLPDRKGRKEIFEVHARNKHFAAEIDFDLIAQRTPGFSGADIENVLNEAAILAVREDKKEIGTDEIDEAIDRVLMGPAKKSRLYSPDEKRRVAIHEAGHTIIGLFLPGSNVVRKVTIIPRGMAGGYNMMTPEEEKFLKTKTDLMSHITSYMGGRVSEEVNLGEISTGAHNDIQEATKIARAMVLEYGMSKLGPIQYQNVTGNVFLGRDYINQQNYSSEVAYEIDKEVRDIIDTAYNKAKEIVKKHAKELFIIVEALMERETLTAEDISELLGIPVVVEES